MKKVFKLGEPLFWAIIAVVELAILVAYVWVQAAKK
jgi:hypothetical protein